MVGAGMESEHKTTGFSHQDFALKTAMAEINLPAELILYIVDCLIPSNPGHLVTRTLLSLTLVCKLISKTARRLLIKHCLQIDSTHRLNRVLRRSALSTTRGNLPRQPSSIGLFLSPFLDNLNVPSTVCQIDCLTNIICNSLTRLVIDMPLRDLWPEDDHQQFRPVLRAAFARLTQLEEFCSVRDELYLDTVEEIAEPEVWSFWPRLRHLALYNAAVHDSRFIKGLCQCPNLTHLVLVRPDGLPDKVPADRMDKDFLPSFQRLIIVNSGSGFSQSTPFDQEMWEETFVGRLHTLRSPGDGEIGDSDLQAGSVVSYLSLRIPFGGEDDEIKLCQEWLSEQATSGRLWEISDDHQSFPYSIHDSAF
ncbi:hypothetical protein BDW62DRAFT_172655 [Aspergillus aurantiobrunneus]